MSLKDQGNDQVRRGNFAKAVELYQRYVEEEHEDNPAAFTNQAQCYFRLGQFRKSIEACENALESNRDNAKAYYRLYLAYKELPNEEYNVFINAHLFLKHHQDDNAPQSRVEATKLRREYKEKFMAKASGQRVEMEQGLIDQLQLLGGQEREVKREEGVEGAGEWLKYFEDPAFTLEEKISRVSEAIVEEGEVAVNRAYLLLNIATKQENRTFISEKIALAKKEHLIRVGEKEEKVEEVEEVEEVEQVREKEEVEEDSERSEQADDSDQNLFESEPQPKDEEKEAVSPPTEVLKVEQSPPNTSPEQQPLKDNNNLPPPVKSQSSSSSAIAEEFEKFMRNHCNSRDILIDLSAIVCQVLRSEVSQQAKRGYLQQLVERCRDDLSLLKYSLKEREGRAMWQLLCASGLEQEFRFCKSY